MLSVNSYLKLAVNESAPKLFAALCAYVRLTYKFVLLDILVIP